MNLKEQLKAVIQQDHLREVLSKACLCQENCKKISDIYGDRILEQVKSGKKEIDPLFMNHCMNLLEIYLTDWFPVDLSTLTDEEKSLLRFGNVIFMAPPDIGKATEKEMRVCFAMLAVDEMAKMPIKKRGKV